MAFPSLLHVLLPHDALLLVLSVVAGGGVSELHDATSHHEQHLEMFMISCGVGSHGHMSSPGLALPDCLPVPAPRGVHPHTDYCCCTWMSQSSAIDDKICTWQSLVWRSEPPFETRSSELQCASETCRRVGVMGLQTAAEGWQRVSACGSPRTSSAVLRTRSSLALNAYMCVG